MLGPPAIEGSPRRQALRPDVARGNLSFLQDGRALIARMAVGPYFSVLSIAYPRPKDCAWPPGPCRLQ